MHCKSLADYSASERRSAERVLDTLDQLENRMEAHFARQRRFNRVQFRGVATIRVPSPDGDPLSIDVFARSLSQGGMSFICPQPIQAERVIVGLHLASGELRWFHGAITRSREVNEESFWEFGIAFHGRADV